VTAVLTALLTVPTLGLAGAMPAKAAADHTQGVTSTGGTGGGGTGSFPIALQNNTRGAFGGNPIQVDRFGFPVTAADADVQRPRHHARHHADPRLAGADPGRREPADRAAARHRRVISR
jgi:hypothetical protein